MKKLIAFLLALLLLTPCVAGAEAASLAAGASITVTGSAAVSLQADYARVTVGVNTSSESIGDASAQNGEAIRAVIAALKEAGVAEEDIATSSYSVNAEYDYSTGTARLAGYSVSNLLTVIIRDMEHIGAVLDQATQAGANSIYNIEFLASESADAQDEAAVHAVEDAMRKARLLAQAAGLSLGGVISIEESSAVIYAQARTYDSAAAKTSSNVIVPDQTTVTASVRMTFALTEAAPAE